MPNEKRILVVTGHYGSGKTNIAVNLAFRQAQEGKRVSLVDLDIVNPYFRTADFRESLEAKGVSVYAPVYANTNLDIPALPAQINSVFDQSAGIGIFDVGGDDAGAIALGQYASRISAAGYEMYYVVNARRYLTHNAQEAVGILREIEAAARLKATGIINNTNLGPETTWQTVEESLPFAREVSALTGLPLVYTCVRRELCPHEAQGYFPVDIWTGKLWGE